MTASLQAGNTYSYDDVAIAISERGNATSPRHFVPLSKALVLLIVALAREQCTGLSTNSHVGRCARLHQEAEVEAKSGASLMNSFYFLPCPIKL